MKLTIEQIIDEIGEIEPIGETNVDAARYDRLREEVIPIVNCLICKIKEASKSKERNEYSMQLIGGLADGYLNELKLDLSED